MSRSCSPRRPGPRSRRSGGAEDLPERLEARTPDGLIKKALETLHGFDRLHATAKVLGHTPEPPGKDAKHGLASPFGATLGATLLHALFLDQVEEDVVSHVSNLRKHPPYE